MSPPAPLPQINDGQNQNQIVCASKTRFIGKHSRDNRLSIFLNHRNSNAPSELLGLVRINRDALHLIQEKGAVVMVGVMARLLCDHGLQFSENFIYQKETPVYPLQAAISSPEIELVPGVLGDAVLPDQFHCGFKLNLPAALPPSCIFLSPDTSTGPGITGDSPWGLTYYLYAYLSTQPHHRKSSKVFLSFTRATPSDPTRLVRETTPPVTTVTRASNPLTGGTKTLSLNAALDRAFFYTGEQMAVHVKIDNPRSINFTGIRITIKQIITTRALNHARQIVKIPLAAYEFRYIDVNGKLQRSPVADGCAPKDFPFIIDTLRVNLKPGQILQHVAVESLFPRNSIKSLLLCPTFAQTYEMQDNPLKYFAVEYYMNVHVVLPWGSNLIAKLPFTVASRGVNESSDTANTVTIDNLANFNPKGDRNLIEIDDEPAEPKTFPSKREHSMPKSPISLEYKIVKCDVERASQILESYRQRQSQKISSSLSSSISMSSPLLSSNSKLSSFEQARRTWTREYCEAFDSFSTGVSSLRNLIEIIFTGNGNNKYVPGLPVELIRSITEKFIPLYNRFLPNHGEHSQVLEEALNQCLDTLELVLVKIHLILISTENSTIDDEVEVNLDDLVDVFDGRLRKELDKLILVIPGMVEWRWFIEELFYRKSEDFNNSVEMGNSNNHFEMAKLFQSIHSRLSEAFSDSQISPNEIFTYAQFCFNGTTALTYQAFHAHYNYFREALLVYYGNYPKHFLPFDSDFHQNEKDLKGMRSNLNNLRDLLIKSMLK